LELVVDIDDALKAGQAVEPESEMQFCATTELEYSVMKNRQRSSREIPNPSRKVLFIIASHVGSVIVGACSGLLDDKAVSDGFAVGTILHQSRGSGFRKLEFLLQKHKEPLERDY